MKIKITLEKSRARKGTESEIYYVREQPYIQGFSMQTTSLTLEGARWQARRWSDVVEISEPQS